MWSSESYLSVRPTGLVTVVTSAYRYTAELIDPCTLMCSFDVQRSAPSSSIFLPSRGWVLFAVHVAIGSEMTVRDRGYSYQLSAGHWGVYVPARETVSCLMKAGSYRILGHSSDIPSPGRLGEGLRVFRQDRMEVSTRAHDVLDLLATRCPAVQMPSCPRPFQFAKRLLDSNLAESIGIGNIAADLKLSREHLTRGFSRCYGLSPKQYLRSLRMNEFLKQIQYEQKSVTETALAAGFNDLSSFVRDFKKAYGVSPSHFIPGRPTASQIAK